jgi:GT2 family glycosyltransferase
MSPRPTLSVILATHNRRDILLSTLDRVRACGLPPDEFETWVVDNGSSDGSAAAVAARPDVNLIRLPQNAGACAKAQAIERARGEFLLLLDDDSYPRPGCVPLMIQRLRSDPRLAAAGFTVHLPDGSQECSALPRTFVGCGVGLRAQAVRTVGGLDRSFFMAAEEYDLAFRLLAADWRVQIFGDLQVEHLKSPGARQPRRLAYYDVRNNLRLIARYLPQPHARIYRQDWLERYQWLAEQAGHENAYRRGVAAGRALSVVERWTYRHWRLMRAALEEIFSWSFVQARMNELRTRGVRRIVLADLGKNVYAFWRGARAAGLQVLAVGDDRFARPGRFYRDVRIVPLEQALRMHADAFVVSNTSYVHADARQRGLSRITRVPVYSWFPPPAEQMPEVCEGTAPAGATGSGTPLFHAGG